MWKLDLKRDSSYFVHTFIKKNICSFVLSEARGRAFATIFISQSFDHNLNEKSDEMMACSAHQFNGCKQQTEKSSATMRQRDLENSLKWHRFELNIYKYTYTCSVCTET